ncbi:hypothetical protein PROFUN_12136 [Planoprotostelium fungivorum]|uniref:Uncharacterized protein n=1 Tax=Planoprotostelium fungivorum TaxID=1890364 RepID=A0A2P6N8A5_9EUKA|nr:hypothetical protein PROFUN_12136 [Planoprotostelium fungivorum]
MPAGYQTWFWTQSMEENANIKYMMESSLNNSPFGKTLTAINVLKNAEVVQYNDQPGGTTKNAPWAHAKGILAFDKINRTGVWIMHSFPGLTVTTIPTSVRNRAQHILCLKINGAYLFIVQDSSHSTAILDNVTGLTEPFVGYTADEPKSFYYFKNPQPTDVTERDTRKSPDIWHSVFHELTSYYYVNDDVFLNIYWEKSGTRPSFYAIQGLQNDANNVIGMHWKRGEKDELAISLAKQACIEAPRLAGILHSFIAIKQYSKNQINYIEPVKPIFLSAISAGKKSRALPNTKYSPKPSEWSSASVEKKYGGVTADLAFEFFKNTHINDVLIGKTVISLADKSSKKRKLEKGMASTDLTLHQPKKTKYSYWY